VTGSCLPLSTFAAEFSFQLGVNFRRRNSRYLSARELHVSPVGFGCPCGVDFLLLSEGDYVRVCYVEAREGKLDQPRQLLWDTHRLPKSTK
jgi:hypothetical protein